MRIVVALGGNALLHRGEPPDAAIQTARVADVAPALMRLAMAHEVVIVHGNGPQVGLLAHESSDDHTLTAPYPLSALGAETQGLIGSLLQQALHNAGLPTPAVTLITHVVVDADDPAMTAPTKFIGAVYPDHEAHQAADRYGWVIAPDGAGWRRVVPSPMPRSVVELASATTLLHSGVTVIMGGGGGIPVTDKRRYHPVDAVVDKDHVAGLIARELDAELLVILTDVAGVIADFGTSAQRVINEATPALLREMPFPSGSMGPKVEAACAFVDATGCRAAIGDLANAERVVEGVAGTQITSTIRDLSRRRLSRE
ncbi:MAG: carbamate kinase [Acidobacteria bacterium]|nr:carbamate kinase [Acidobacteriota bacterium]